MRISLNLDSRKSKGMPIKRYMPEQIIGMPRQAEIELAGGRTTGEACRSLGISEQSYYRWRKEYGGMRVAQARRLKDLERENQRLRKRVADLSLDKQILEEACKGNF